MARRGGRRTRDGLRVLLVWVAVLAALRAALPVLVARHVDRVVDGIEGYQGSLRKLELNLYRGAYEVEGLRVDKRTADAVAPFLQIGRLDLSVDWRALAGGELVAQAILHEPVLDFVVTGDEETSQAGDDRDWAERLDALFPFRFDELAFVDGTIHYVDRRSDPPIDVWLEDVDLLVQNLTNVREEEARPGGSLPTTAVLTARPMGEGWLAVHLGLDPLAAEPRMDVDLALEDVELVRLNDVLQAVAGVDAEDGTLHVFLELAVADGRVEGYVKPFLQDLQVASWSDVTDPIEALEAVWEGIVGLAGEILENHPHERLATRIPISGELEDPDAPLWTSVLGVVRNAFVEPLDPEVEGDVTLADAEAAAATAPREDGEARP